jgi:hypothetical protein
MILYFLNRVILWGYGCYVVFRIFSLMLQIHWAQHSELGAAMGPIETDGDENATQPRATDSSQV